VCLLKWYVCLLIPLFLIMASLPHHQHLNVTITTVSCIFAEYLGRYIFNDTDRWLNLKPRIN